MEIRAIAPNEWNYTYSQSMQITGQTGNIGHLRGDFDSGGYGFYTTWSDHRPQWKTDEFKTELDEVINTLRSKEYGLLLILYYIIEFAMAMSRNGSTSISAMQKKVSVLLTLITRSCFVFQTAAKFVLPLLGAKSRNTLAVISTSTIPKSAITSIISASLPSVWKKTVRPMSRYLPSRRRSKHRSIRI